MSASNIIVSDVKKSKNKVLCVTRIDNYQNMLKHVDVGESIRTEPIQLNFHNSIGTSSWILLFYPKGQYMASDYSTVLVSGQASVYLKMISCENQNESLATIIKIFIKSPYCDFIDEYVTTKCAKFTYRNLKERWNGPFDLTSTKELYSRQCKKLFLNDSLTIGFELNEVRRKDLSISMDWLQENPNMLPRSYDAASTGSALNDATSRRSIPRLHHSSEVSVPDGKTSAPERTIQKRMSTQHSFLALREGELKENNEPNVCTCGQSNPKISRETQTLGEKLLQSCNANVGARFFRSTVAAHRNHFDKAGCCVKDAINYFESMSISRSGEKVLK